MTSNVIIHDLLKLKEYIRDYSANRLAEEGIKVRQTLKALINRENKALMKYARIVNDTKNIENFDTGILQKFRQDFGRLPANAKKYIADEILDESKKIRMEEGLKKVEASLRINENNFKYCLQEIINSLKALDFIKAQEWIDKAIIVEKHKERHLESLGSLEQKILHLNSYGLKILKRLMNKKMMR